jgi:general stress protein YciG
MSNGVKKRGFASMDPVRRKELATKGGKAVPAGRRSFAQDRELASAAGRKGGESKARGMGKR